MWHTDDIRLYVELLVFVSALMLVSRGPPLSFCPSKEKHQVKHKHISDKGRWTHLSFLFRPLQLHSTCTSQLRLTYLVVQKDGFWHTAFHQPPAGQCGGFWWKWGNWKEEMNFNIMQCNEYKSMLMLKSLLSHLLHPDKNMYKDNFMFIFITVHT